MELLAEPRSVAVISDAGLPGISDPGEELVAEARRCGHEVICIPGPCAATTALVSSGLPSNRFCFEGFLPAKGRGRRERMAQIVCETRTTVIYEAPHRLLTLLEDLEKHCGAERPVQVARELTKRHEQQVGPNLGAALAHFPQNAPQGECTVVLGGAPSQNVDPEPDDSELQRRLQVKIQEGSSASEAARRLAMETGLPKRRLYALLHQGSRQTESIDGLCCAAAPAPSVLSFGAGLLLLLLLCLGAQNGRDRHSIQLGGSRSVPLPSGFLVGMSLVIGVISGGCAWRFCCRINAIERLNEESDVASRAIRLPSITSLVMPRASR